MCARYIYLCIYIYHYICVCVCVCVRVRVFVCVCVRVRAHICIIYVSTHNTPPRRCMVEPHPKIWLVNQARYLWPFGATKLGNGNRLSCKSFLDIIYGNIRTLHIPNNTLPFPRQTTHRNSWLNRHPPPHPPRIFFKIRVPVKHGNLRNPVVKSLSKKNWPVHLS